MTTLHEHGTGRTGLRSWSRARWIVLGAVALAIVAAVILIVAYSGGGGGSGGGY